MDAIFQPIKKSDTYQIKLFCDNKKCIYETWEMLSMFQYPSSVAHITAHSSVITRSVYMRRGRVTKPTTAGIIVMNRVVIVSTVKQLLLVKISV